MKVTLILLGGLGTCMLCLSGSASQAAFDEETPWPRVRSTNGYTVTIYQPQVERWASNSFTARAAVEVKAAKKAGEVGVVWFEAQGTVDRPKRVVMLDRLEILKGRFHDSPDNGSNALAVLRNVMPASARTVSLDYLITTLGFTQGAARQGAAGLKHSPPKILWTTNHSVLILVDGEPVLRPTPNGPLQRVVNTPALMVKDPATIKYYVSGEGRWFASGSINGPWSLVQTPPAEITAMQGGSGPISNSDPEGTSQGTAPRLVVSTEPAELLMTRGLPDYRPIRGTALLYAANTDNQLFFDKPGRESYVLLSGRWFKAKSLHGPWTYVSPKDLPADFARIPPGSPQAIVLASVPNTPQADLAIVANSVPTTATVNRRETRLKVSYDGEPQFKPMEGTDMSYAVNAELPVVRVKDIYYTVRDAVWFVAESAEGPWEVATEVPEEIYTIPPSSPVYYATFARVYQATDDEVEVGYTPGYLGAYEDEGTVVYGTGWDYESWSGEDYYSWGWTWGYSYTYVPWYQWWVWRPWWNDIGGLRAALIENIYDRWQDHNVVTPHDRGAPSAPQAPSARSAPSAASARSAERAPAADRAELAQRAPSADRAPSAPQAPSAGPPGHPALYGRFKGTRQPAAMTPPADTLALNPYSRPQSSVRPGEVPRGAQRLSELRQTPGGGRDYYASPNGSVYRQMNNNWYRREPNGGWSFYASAQARVESRNSPGGNTPQLSPVSGNQPVTRSGAVAGGRNQLGNRVPDAGSTARAQELATLEREYYARALSQMRAQNWRGSGNYARPARSVGRRR